ncbi:MAG: Fe3+ hydroxamate ABC transporter substrate-binding protein [Anaerolineaceae bacterium]|nr:Fe3+ hydroxamate ABC transporter substrate-binding protein [Anaerolineaceae bacterium]
MDENEISRYIVSAAIEAHRTLGGPGLLESVYEEALAFELIQQGIKVERQKLLPIVYKGIQLATPLRMDIVVGELVIVECKAVEGDHKLFVAQALTYLRLTGLKLALIINFNERLVKNGIRRIVNNL